MNSPNISRCPECNREYRYRFHSSELECPMGHVWQMKDERYVSEYREEQARVAQWMADRRRARGLGKADQ